MNKKVVSIVGFAAAAGLVLAACGGATPTPQVIEKKVEVVVTKEVVKEVAKEVEKKVEVVVTKEVIKEVVKPAGDRIPVRWYVGLGTGSNKDQIPVQKAFVDKYNKSQDKYQLIIEIVDNPVAAQNLKAQIAAGNAPDIIGPVGADGRSAFQGGLLDLAPLIKKANLDLSKVDQRLMDFVKSSDGQVGVPYAIFPAVIFYNKDSFKEAGLNPPPQKFGEKYKWPDGREVEWNVDTIFELANKMTVDKNGKDATQAGFDAKNIRQWGFNQQWGDPRNEMVLCGAGSAYDAANKAGKLPDNWRDCLKKMYDAMWKTHSYPNAEANASELLSTPNAFASGNVAMAYTHSWYMCCMADGNLKSWGVGVAPSYKGVNTSKMHGDTFSILKGSKSPDAAFQVMLDIEADPSLQVLYGGLPNGDQARKDFFAGKEKQYNLKPGDVNWQVFVDSIPFPDVPTHENWMPNYLKAKTRLAELQTLMASKPGLNLDAEFKKVEDDLTKIFAETNQQ